jgi:methylglutaconyl-CoA hydratase
MTQSARPILVEDHDAAVRMVTLNRPDKRNAMSLELIERLRDAVHESAADRNRRVIIIRGAGPHFCAGLDLKEVSAAPQNAERSARALAEMYEAVASSPLVTIAAAQGTAVGGGAGLLAACDFVVAADDFHVGFPEVHRGLVAALVTTLLRRQLDDRKVRELTILGQTVDADSALRIGLINRVVPVDRLTEASLELAREACKGAPGAIARTKKLLDALSVLPISEELARALEYHLTARHSAEAEEGVAAFLEKRPPRWGPRPEEEM